MNKLALSGAFQGFEDLMLRLGFAQAVLTMAAIVFSASVGQSQQKPSPAEPTVPLIKGTVVGNTYKNVSLGLALSAAPGLKLGDPVLKGTPGSVPLLVTVSAKGVWRLFSAVDDLAFYADTLTYYPENRRSTGDYVRRVERAQVKQGLEVVKDQVETQFGATPFARVDFKATGLYEAVLLKACSTYAYVFIFAGSDPQRVNDLIARTKLTLDLQTSGCGPQATTAPSKK